MRNMTLCSLLSGAAILASAPALPQSAGHAYATISVSATVISPPILTEMAYEVKKDGASPLWTQSYHVKDMLLQKDGSPMAASPGEHHPSAHPSTGGHANISVKYAASRGECSVETRVLDAKSGENTPETVVVTFLCDSYGLSAARTVTITPEPYLTRK